MTAVKQAENLMKGEKMNESHKRASHGEAPV